MDAAVLRALLTDVAAAAPAGTPQLHAGNTLVLWADARVPGAVLSRLGQHQLLAALRRPCSSDGRRAAEFLLAASSGRLTWEQVFTGAVCAAQLDRQQGSKGPAAGAQQQQQQPQYQQVVRCNACHAAKAPSCGAAAADSNVAQLASCWRRGSGTDVGSKDWISREDVEALYQTHLPPADISEYIAAHRHQIDQVVRRALLGISAAADPDLGTAQAALRQRPGPLTALCQAAPRLPELLGLVNCGVDALVGTWTAFEKRWHEEWLALVAPAPAAERDSRLPSPDVPLQQWSKQQVAIARKAVAEEVPGFCLHVLLLQLPPDPALTLRTLLDGAPLAVQTPAQALIAACAASTTGVPAWPLPGAPYQQQAPAPLPPPQPKAAPAAAQASNGGMRLFGVTLPAGQPGSTPPRTPEPTSAPEAGACAAGRATPQQQHKQAPPSLLLPRSLTQLRSGTGSSADAQTKVTPPKHALSGLEAALRSRQQQPQQPQAAADGILPEALRPSICMVDGQPYLQAPGGGALPLHMAQALPPATVAQLLTALAPPQRPAAAVAPQQPPPQLASAAGAAGLPPQLLAALAATISGPPMAPHVAQQAALAALGHPAAQLQQAAGQRQHFEALAALNAALPQPLQQAAMAAGARSASQPAAAARYRAPPAGLMPLGDRAESIEMQQEAAAALELLQLGPGAAAAVPGLADAAAASPAAEVTADTKAEPDAVIMPDAARPDAPDKDMPPLVWPEHCRCRRSAAAGPRAEPPAVPLLPGQSPQPAAADLSVEDKEAALALGGLVSSMEASTASDDSAPASTTPGKPTSRWRIPRSRPGSGTGPRSGGGRAKVVGPCTNPACGITDSPCWRKGPPSMPVLCNACGTRWARSNSMEKMAAVPRSAASSDDRLQVLDFIPGQPRPATIAAAAAAAAERGAQPGASAGPRLPPQQPKPARPSLQQVLRGQAAQKAADKDPEAATADNESRAQSSASPSTGKPAARHAPRLPPRPAAVVASGAPAAVAPGAPAAPADAAAARSVSPAPAAHASGTPQGAEAAPSKQAADDSEPLLAAAAQMLLESSQDAARRSPGAAAEQQRQPQQAEQAALRTEGEPAAALQSGTITSSRAMSEQLAAERMAGLGPQARSRVIAAGVRAATSTGTAAGSAPMPAAFTANLLQLRGVMQPPPLRGGAPIPQAFADGWPTLDGRTLSASFLDSISMQKIKQGIPASIAAGLARRTSAPAAAMSAAAAASAKTTPTPSREARAPAISAAATSADLNPRKRLGQLATVAASARSIAAPPRPPVVLPPANLAGSSAAAAANAAKFATFLQRSPPQHGLPQLHDKSALAGAVATADDRTGSGPPPAATHQMGQLDVAALMDGFFLSSCASPGLPSPRPLLEDPEALLDAAAAAVAEARAAGTLPARRLPSPPNSPPLFGLPPLHDGEHLPAASAAATQKARLQSRTTQPFADPSGSAKRAERLLPKRSPAGQLPQQHDLKQAVATPAAAGPHQQQQQQLTNGAAAAAAAGNTKDRATAAISDAPTVTASTVSIQRSEDQGDAASHAESRLLTKAGGKLAAAGSIGNTGGKRKRPAGKQTPQASPDARDDSVSPISDEDYLPLKKRTAGAIKFRSVTHLQLGDVQQSPPQLRNGSRSPA